MNEKELAIQVKEIIDVQIDKAMESVNLKLAVQNELISNLSEIVDVVKEFGLENNATLSEYKSNNSAIETKLTESQETLSDLLNGKIDKATDTVDLKLAVQSELIAEAKSFIESASEAFKNKANVIQDNFIELETRSLEFTTTHAQTIEEKFDALNVINKEEIVELSTQLKSGIESSTETLNLKLNNTQNEELLRLNNHINKKLDALKGDKGDAGEKGDKGEDGFLSGVSKWETGSITCENEAKTFDNGLWICQVPQTAASPCIGDDWGLIVDGISDIKMNDSNIEVKFASGKTRNIGRAGYVHKGVYSDKKTYSKNDIVTLNKTAFVSMEDDNANNPPSNNWKLLSGKGDKGAKGDRGGNLEPKELTTLIIDVVEGMK